MSEKFESLKPLGAKGVNIAIEVLKEHGMTQEQAQQVLYDMQARGVATEYLPGLIEVVREGQNR